MIRIYLFTYAGDADEALVCVRCAAAALPEAVITVADDESTPIAERARTALVEAGARYCQTRWPRNGNLRGPECVRGIISTLAGEAEDDDVIVKIDSDTLLLSGDWVRDMQRHGLALHASGYQVPAILPNALPMGRVTPSADRQPDWRRRSWNRLTFLRSRRKTSPSAGRFRITSPRNKSALMNPGRPFTGKGNGRPGTGSALP